MQCKSTEFTSVELFVIWDTVKDETTSLLDTRLKYAKMLQSWIVGDSLAMAENLQTFPRLYVEYIQDFIGIMNRHLKDMDSRMRLMMLGFMQANSIEKQVLRFLVRINGQKLELGISMQEADKLGMVEEYRFLNERVCPQYDDLKKDFTALNDLPKYRE